MNKGAWISPEGDLYDLGKLTHYQYMLKYPKLFKLTRPQIQSIRKSKTPEDTARLIALDKNWIRMRYQRRYHELEPTFELKELTQSKMGDIIVFLRYAQVHPDTMVEIHELKFMKGIRLTTKEVVEGEVEVALRNPFGLKFYNEKD